jgi:antitoxin HicB
MMLSYPLTLTADGDTSLVTCPDLPEVTTFGEDRDDACERARDAIAEALAYRIAHQEPIPEPSAGEPRAALSTQTALKVCVYREMRERGVSKTDLARRLHWHRPQIDRLLDLNHSTRLDAFDAAFSELGCDLDVRVERGPLTVDETEPGHA